MTYRAGDYVYPTDLPRRFLCRVMQAETLAVGRESCQILKLEPLEGPWPSGTNLIRLDPVVVRAGARELWAQSVPERTPAGPRRVAARAA
ncbi:MAG TPA: hypothetical protein VKA21_08915 [Candidatus Binatia bacterium]|nr:hypothetical protein [Candidatus Binatia bacterium]